MSTHISSIAPNKPSFEEDFDTPEFLAARTKEFDLRRQTFHGRELSVVESTQIQKRQASNDPMALDEVFKLILPAAEFERFWELCGLEHNPVKTATVIEIVQWLTGGGEGKLHA